jgi:hypothetical protein
MEMNTFKTLIFGLAAVLVCFSLAGAADENDAVPGYDENTEITVKGVITDTGATRRGPVVLQVKTDAKSFEVITAPRWYLAQQGISFASGEKIEVTGSKYIAQDGRLSLIAHTIKISGRTTDISLRDGSCRPLWMGHGRGMGRMGR